MSETPSWPGNQATLTQGDDDRPAGKEAPPPPAQPSLRESRTERVLPAAATWDIIRQTKTKAAKTSTAVRQGKKATLIGG